MASLLIIGGSGFFGKSILDGFQRGLLKPWGITEVLVLSRNPSILTQEFSKLVTPRVQLIKADITACNELPFADFVVHAAASTDAGKYIINSTDEANNISLGVKNYCRLALRHHRNSKILYVSSGAVYGFQPNGKIETREDCITSSTLDALPINKIAYAKAKRESENLIQQLGQQGLAVSVARCFSFVGKYLPLDQHFALGNFIGNGLRGETITINAQHQVYRSYLYADDLVEWLMSIAMLGSEDCPIFNVGSDQEISIHELANLVGTCTGARVTQTQIKDTVIDRYVPTIEKAIKFDMKIKYNLKNAITTTINELSLRS